MSKFCIYLVECISFAVKMKNDYMLVPSYSMLKLYSNTLLWKLLNTGEYLAFKENISFKIIQKQSL